MTIHLHEDEEMRDLFNPDSDYDKNDSDSDKIV